jgi:hypothetical protein
MSKSKKVETVKQTLAKLASGELTVDQALSGVPRAEEARTAFTPHYVFSPECRSGACGHVAKEPTVDSNGVTVNQGRLGSVSGSKEVLVSKKSKKVQAMQDEGAGVVEMVEEILAKTPRVKKEKVVKEKVTKTFKTQMTRIEYVVLEVQAASRKEAKALLKQYDAAGTIDTMESTSRTVTKYRVLRG